MNTDLALSLIGSRMQDMGYNSEDYSLSGRHFVLAGDERREVEAYNEFYFLEHDPEDVTIQSDFGFYDLSFQKINELKYEHEGLIQLANLSSATNHVRFIQVILKHKAKR